MTDKHDGTTGRKAAGERRRQRPPLAPARVTVWSSDNQQVREVSLSGEVFAVPVNQHLIYEAVKQHRAGARRGTHMTKSRGLTAS